MARIKAALAPCQTCEVGRVRCPVSLDKSSISDRALTHAVERSPAPGNNVTTLTPEAEDAARIALATIFQLDPVEILLLQHVMSGRSYASFREVLGSLKKRLAKYRCGGDNNSFRALAHFWAKNVIKKFPAIAPVFAAMVDKNKGKHDRVNPPPVGSPGK